MKQDVLPLADHRGVDPSRIVGDRGPRTAFELRLAEDGLAGRPVFPALVHQPGIPPRWRRVWAVALKGGRFRLYDYLGERRFWSPETAYLVDSITEDPSPEAGQPTKPNHERKRP